MNWGAVAGVRTATSKCGKSTSLDDEAKNLAFAIMLFINIPLIILIIILCWINLL